MSDSGDELIPFLVEAGCDPGVIAHVKTVRDVAVRYADILVSCGHPVDRSLVVSGAILHDIGRAKTHGMGHADESGAICRSLGFEEKICRIVERHIGAGIYAHERVAFGLSEEDRIPETIEEKIVAHADNMVKGTRVLDRNGLMRSIEKHPEAIQARFIALADEIDSLCCLSPPAEH